MAPRLRSASKRNEGPTSIASLPLELLELIMYEVSLQEDPAIYYCALACSAFTRPALKYLYHSLVVTSSESAQALLDSPAFHRHRVYAIVFHGIQFFDKTSYSSEMEQVLVACAPRLVELSFYGMDKVPVHLFWKISLPELRALDLGCDFEFNLDDPLTEDSALPPSGFLPLHLTSLGIRGVPSEIRTAMALVVITRSILESDTHQGFSLCINGMADPICISLLHILSHRITRFYVNAVPTLEILPFLAAENISQFGLGSITNLDLQVALKSLHTQVKRFSVLLEDSEKQSLSTDTVKALSEAFTGTDRPQLEDFEMNVREDAIRRVDGGKEFLDMLNAKGVTLSLKNFAAIRV